MDNQTLISVIVPVYNVEKYLERCVRSILNQTYAKLEIILVDDGSTDDSGNICDEFGKTDDRVVVIHKSNGGLSSARNAGIQTAKGEYLSFIDSDDYIEAEMLETMLNLCLKNKVLLCCCGRYEEYTDSDEVKIGLCPADTEVFSSEEFVKKIFTWDGVNTAACDKLYHKSLWEKLRFPEGMVSEDMRVVYKTCLLSGYVVTCAAPFYHYCHRPDSITTSGFSAKRLDMLQQMYDIYCFIRENHPNLLEYATIMRVRQTMYIAGQIASLDKESYLKFKPDYKESVYLLRLFKSKWINSELVSKREKKLMCCHIFGIYRIGVMIYRKIKRD